MIILILSAILLFAVVIKVFQYFQTGNNLWAVQATILVILMIIVFVTEASNINNTNVSWHTKVQPNWIDKMSAAGCTVTGFDDNPPHPILTCPDNQPQQ